MFMLIVKAVGRELASAGRVGRLCAACVMLCFVTSIIAACDGGVDSKLSAKQPGAARSGDGSGLGPGATPPSVNRRIDAFNWKDTLDTGEVYFSRSDAYGTRGDAYGRLSGTTPQNEFTYANQINLPYALVDGKPSCASNGQGGCHWGHSVEELEELDTVIPLLCGAKPANPRTDVHYHSDFNRGVTGLDTRGHWCQKLAVLTAQRYDAPSALSSSSSGGAIDLTDWIRNGNGNLTTNASSNSWGGHHSKVADGNNDGSEWANTNNGPNEWVTLDLGANYELTKLELYGRHNAVGYARLVNANVLLLDGNDNVVRTVGTITNRDLMGMVNGGPITFTFPATVARTIKVTHSNQFLTIAELRAFGSRPTSQVPTPETTLTQTRGYGLRNGVYLNWPQTLSPATVTHDYGYILDYRVSGGPNTGDSNDIVRMFALPGSDQVSRIDAVLYGLQRGDIVSATIRGYVFVNDNMYLGQATDAVELAVLPQPEPPLVIDRGANNLDADISGNQDGGRYRVFAAREDEFSLEEIITERSTDAFHITSNNHAKRFTITRPGPVKLATVRYGNTNNSFVFGSVSEVTTHIHRAEVTSDSGMEVEVDESQLMGWGTQNGFHASWPSVPGAKGYSVTYRLAGEVEEQNKVAYVIDNSVDSRASVSVSSRDFVSGDIITFSIRPYFIVNNERYYGRSTQQIKLAVFPEPRLTTDCTCSINVVIQDPPGGKYRIFYTNSNTQEATDMFQNITTNREIRPDLISSKLNRKLFSSAGFYDLYVVRYGQGEDGNYVFGSIASVSDFFHPDKKLVGRSIDNTLVRSSTKRSEFDTTRDTSAGWCEKLTSTDPFMPCVPDHVREDLGDQTDDTLVLEKELYNGYEWRVGRVVYKDYSYSGAIPRFSLKFNPFYSTDTDTFPFAGRERVIEQQFTEQKNISFIQTVGDPSMVNSVGGLIPDHMYKWEMLFYNMGVSIDNLDLTGDAPLYQLYSGIHTDSTKQIPHFGLYNRETGKVRIIAYYDKPGGANTLEICLTPVNLVYDQSTDSTIEAREPSKCQVVQTSQLNFAVWADFLTDFNICNCFKRKNLELTFRPVVKSNIRLQGALAGLDLPIVDGRQSLRYFTQYDYDSSISDNNASFLFSSRRAALSRYQDWKNEINIKLEGDIPLGPKKNKSLLATQHALGMFGTALGMIPVVGGLFQSMTGLASAGIGIHSFFPSGHKKPPLKLEGTSKLPDPMAHTTMSALKAHGEAITSYDLTRFTYVYPGSWRSHARGDLEHRGKPGKTTYHTGMGNFQVINKPKFKLTENTAFQNAYTAKSFLIGWAPRNRGSYYHGITVKYRPYVCDMEFIQDRTMRYSVSPESVYTIVSPYIDNQDYDLYFSIDYSMDVKHSSQSVLFDNTYDQTQFGNLQQTNTSYTFASYPPGSRDTHPNTEPDEADNCDAFGIQVQDRPALMWLNDTVGQVTIKYKTQTAITPGEQYAYNQLSGGSLNFSDMSSDSAIVNVVTNILPINQLQDHMLHFELLYKDIRLPITTGNTGQEHVVKHLAKKIYNNIYSSLTRDDHINFWTSTAAWWMRTHGTVPWYFKRKSNPSQDITETFFNYGNDTIRGLQISSNERAQDINTIISSAPDAIILGLEGNTKINNALLMNLPYARGSESSQNNRIMVSSSTPGKFNIQNPQGTSKDSVVNVHEDYDFSDYGLRNISGILTLYFVTKIDSTADISTGVVDRITGLTFPKNRQVKTISIPFDPFDASVDNFELPVNKRLPENLSSYLGVNFYSNYSTDVPSGLNNLKRDPLAGISLPENAYFNPNVQNNRIMNLAIFAEKYCESTHSMYSPFTAGLLNLNKTIYDISVYPGMRNVDRVALFYDDSDNSIDNSSDSGTGNKYVWSRTRPNPRVGVDDYVKVHEDYILCTPSNYPARVGFVRTETHPDGYDYEICSSSAPGSIESISVERLLLWRTRGSDIWVNVDTSRNLEDYAVKTPGHPSTDPINKPNEGTPLFVCKGNNGRLGYVDTDDQQECHTRRYDKPWFGTTATSNFTVLQKN